MRTSTKANYVYCDDIGLSFLYLYRTQQYEPQTINPERKWKKLNCGSSVSTYRTKPKTTYPFLNKCFNSFTQKSSSCKLHFSVKLTVKDQK